MKNKKVLVIVGLILSVVLLFGLTGCDKDPTITQVQSDITTLQSEITTINTNVANLQASVAGIQVPNLTPINNSITAIQTKLTSLESDLADLQDSLNDPNSYATKAELNIITGDLTSLSNTVSTINTDLTELTSIVSSLSNRIESLENDVDSFLTVDGLDLSDIENYIIDLRSRVSDLEDIVDDINVPDVTQFQDDIDTLYENDLYLDGRIDILESQINDKILITSFDEVHNQLIFKTNIAGNYAVILTFYGTGFVSDTGEVSIPTADNVRVMAATAYASGTILTVIIEPPLVQTGNPPVWVDTNWAINKIVGVTITTGDVQYVTVETAVR